MRRIRMFAFALVLSSLVASTNLTAQQPATSESPVLLNVTVTNSRGDYRFGRPDKGFVTDLGQEAFTVYDDNVPQQISFFSNDDVPASVAIVVETSSSMIPRKGADVAMRTVAAAVLSFIQHGNPANEYFLVTSGDDGAHLLLDWTVDGTSIVNTITSLKLKGGGALFDACHMSVDKVSRGKYRKHVVLVFATGRYAKSKLSYKEVRNQLRGSDALLYIFFPPVVSIDNQTSFRAVPEVEELPKETGGRFLYSHPSAKLLALQAELIALETRHQYLIGFVPKDSAKRNKWHSLTVRADPGTNPPRDMKQLFTRNRVGYWGN